MPVQKFRSHEEARRALWVPSGDLSLPSRMKGLWAFAARLFRRVPPRGVQKFRSIQEANRERESWPPAPR